MRMRNYSSEGRAGCSHSTMIRGYSTMTRSYSVLGKPRCRVEESRRPIEWCFLVESDHAADRQSLDSVGLDPVLEVTSQWARGSQKRLGTGSGRRDIAWWRRVGGIFHSNGQMLCYRRSDKVKDDAPDEIGAMTRVNVGR